MARQHGFRKQTDMTRLWLTYFVVLLVSGVCSRAQGDDWFTDHVAPVFAKRCASCHNDDISKGGFSLEDAESFFDADVVQPGDVDSSHLIELITAQGGDAPEMPKNAPALLPEEVDAIRKWIEDGAQWTAGHIVQPDSQIDFDWWSLKQISTPDVPHFEDEFANGWIQTPITGPPGCLTCR